MTKNKGIVYFGADGGCLDAIYLASELFNKQGYLLSDKSVFISSDLTHLGGFDAIEDRKLAGHNFVYQCGNVSNHVDRHKYFKKAIAEGLIPLTCISKHAFVHPTAKIGQGVIIYPGACVMRDVTLGDNVIILPNSVINHDCIIGEFTIINSGVVLNGEVNCGSNVFIGASSVLRERTVITNDVTIGLGSLILTSIMEKGVYFGRPAKKKTLNNRS